MSFAALSTRFVCEVSVDASQSLPVIAKSESVHVTDLGFTLTDGVAHGFSDISDGKANRVFAQQRTLVGNGSETFDLKIGTLIDPLNNVFSFNGGLDGFGSIKFIGIQCVSGTLQVGGNIMGGPLVGNTTMGVTNGGTLLYPAYGGNTVLNLGGPNDQSKLTVFNKSSSSSVYNVILIGY